MTLNNRSFVAVIVPDTELKKYHVSQAGNNFCLNLIDGNYLFEKTYAFSHIYVKEEIKAEINNISGGFCRIQCRFFPHVSVFKYLNIIIENIFLINKQRKYNGPIWFYNLQKFNLFSFATLKYIYRKRVYIILADFTPATRILSFQNIVRYFINSANGIITLSDKTSLKNLNRKTIAGIISKNKNNSKNKDIIDINNKTFLFSGTLNKITGIKLALDVFTKIPEATLIVTGRGDLESIVQETSSVYPNIIYKGFVSYDEYINLLDSIDFCLSFRDPQIPENDYNFPSKVIEYLLYNKIVLSTVKYPQLDGINYFSADYDLYEMMALVKSIVNGDFKSTISKYLNQSGKIEELFSYQRWRDVMQSIENNK